ncbi:TetR/AcrR family transcriptional regulator [Saccharothrix xinjiangensis]|uniref:TetR/AcrR family transcriptional regulator n=1 Tax=Saccharothrix xinjiangensis TaxID=204798 RepID=A0ABV9Y0P1_9PSEU
MTFKGGSGRGPRSLRNQRPLDAEQVVAAAVRLTRLHGLGAWTLRQLADELESWPAVVYHHVGDREAVIAAVVDHVLHEALDVVPEKEWRDWFEVVLHRLREVLRQHTGVAQWLAVNGPAVPAMLRLIDRGVLLLTAAGFGDESPFVYSTLVDAAVQQIAAEDGKDSPSHPCEEAERMIAEYRDSVDHRGLALMAVACEDHRKYDDLYTYRVERVLDGIAVRLAELRGGSPA